MMTNRQTIGLVIVALMITGACNRTRFDQAKKENDRGIPQKTNLVAPQKNTKYGAGVFYQTASTKSQSVDIVWAIDSSKSMKDEISAINRNLPKLIADLDARHVDYRIALIMQDTLRLNIKIPSIVKNCRSAADLTSKLCLFESPVNSMNSLMMLLQCHKIPYSGSFLPMFKNVQTKTGLLTAQKWPCGTGSGFGSKASLFSQFLRPNIHKQIVIVSDDESLIPADSFIQAFKTAEKEFSLSAIVGVDPKAALLKGSSFVKNTAKTRQDCTIDHVSTVYPDAARKTGGVVIDICEKDWGAIFEKLVAEILRKSTFILPQKPSQIARIEVKVNGKEAVTETQTGGRLVRENNWVYDQKSNSIVFNSGKEPAVGAEIRVVYPIN